VAVTPPIGAGERPAEEQSMKGGSKLFVFAGVGLALIAVLLFVVSMNGGGKADAEKKAENEKVTVVQAAAAIPAHQVLTATDLVERQVNVADAPSDPVTSITAVVGQAYRVSLQAGQSLSTAQVETPGLRNDIAAGKRAIALPVDQVSAMSGLVQDGDFVDIVFHARINLVRQVASTAVWLPEDAEYALKDPPVLPPSDVPDEIFPVAGDDGSIFQIQDEGGQLQPVAKIILQDIRVLRVVRPGETYLGNGMLADDSVTDAVPTSTDKKMSQFILEVNPEQAEAITFMQDTRHQYQVVVRGKDDHESVTTVGITFQILATDPDLALPWPKSVIAPEAKEKKSAKSTSESGT
jgi:Flp pilus assembly protein CpaB